MRRAPDIQKANRTATRTVTCLLLGLSVACQDPGERPEMGATSPTPAVSSEEFAARRAHLMGAIPDGIVLLQARPAEKAMEQWGFIQDPAFLYYTGLAETPGAILALDGREGTTHLFLPPAPMSFGMPVEGLVPAPGAETASRLELTEARPWTDFVPWVRERLGAGVPALYLDEARRPEAPGVPDGMRAVSGARNLWRETVTEAFPQARVQSAKQVIMEQRAVKSEVELALLDRNARATATSLLAVASALRPGVTQRETESAMVDACLKAGGQGPSFWPWTMSGPNAHVERLVGAFYRYDQADRQARAGELVRVDIGCAGGLYGADVGRTLPVSGAFTAGQAEAWDLLIRGYRAGLEAMGDGVSVDEVRAASIEAVRAVEGDLVTTEGRAAAGAILEGGSGVWHIHGVGVESGEDIPPTLRTGMVVAYEPGFSIGPDAYYLEDMIAITPDGHRILSSGLPYTAVEIEGVMRPER